MPVKALIVTHIFLRKWAETTCGTNCKPSLWPSCRHSPASITTNTGVIGPLYALFSALDSGPEPALSMSKGRSDEQTFRLFSKNRLELGVTIRVKASMTMPSLGGRKNRVQSPVLNLHPQVQPELIEMQLRRSPRGLCQSYAACRREER
jgi:hypothetical protein